MPRAPPGLSLLLMAALAFAATPPQISPTDEKDDKLKIINPWLSACDLMQPASSTDLKGACPDMWGPGGPSCPQPCPPSPPPQPPPATIAAAASSTSTTTTTTGGSSSSSSSGGATTSTTTTTTTTNHTTATASVHHSRQQLPHDGNHRNSNSNNNNSTTQCLFKYLKESHKEEVCGGEGVSRGEERRKRLSGFRMRHCCEHAVHTSLPASALDGDAATCARHVDALLAVDALAARISCEFAEVLYRYDCGQKYSIKHQCEDCKEAYRRWVCSSMVPHYFNRTARVRPCPSVCQSVEQKCPYMLPGDRAPAHPTQYAGEPTFLCLDPNIPETGDQRLKSSVGDEDCCYNYSNKCRSRGRSALCVHCPHGPADIPATPVNCAAGMGNGTTSCSTGAATITTSAGTSTNSGGGGGSSSASTSLASRRTLNTVLPLWTAWIMLIQLLVAPAPIAATTHTLYLLVRRLDVFVNMLCAFSVRTSSLLMTRILKTKWRSRGRWS